MAKVVAVARSLVDRRGLRLQAQRPPPQPTNDLPNPYQTIEDYFKMPEGRTWGSTSAVDVDRTASRSGSASAAARTRASDSTLDPVLKFDASGTLVKSFGAGTDDLSARDPRRQGRQHLGDRRAGQQAAPRARRAAGFAAAAGAGEDHRPPGVQVQPRRQAADDARHGRRRPRRRLLLPAERRPRRAERRHLRLRGTRVDRRLERARAEVRQDRQVPQVVGQVRQGTRRVRSAARAGDGLEGTPVRRRSRQQPHPDLRSGRQVPRGVDAVQPSERHRHRRRATTSTSPTPSRARSTRAHGAWTRGIRIGSAKDGKVTAFIPDPWKTCARASAHAGGAVRHQHQRRRRRRRRSRRATSTAPKSDRAR